MNTVLLRIFVLLYFQKNACEHIDQSPLMFGAAQCLGYRMEHGKATKEMCYPSDKTIIKDVSKVLKKTEITTVFVATDSKDLIKKMSKELENVSYGGKCVI